MKYIITSVLILFSVLCFAQEATIDAKEVFPELFQLKLPVKIPNIQRVDEEQVFFKKGKLKNLKLNESNQEIYDVNLKNDISFKGEVKKRYSDGAFSFKNGTIKFSNGDSYEGDFFEGKPVNGTYNFANGDKVAISSYKIYDRPSSYSGMKVPTDKKFTFANGDILDFKANDEFEFIATDGTKIKSNFDNRYQLIGKTYYKTKEGYEYSGELFAFGPSGKWSVSNQYGSFTVEFSFGFGNTVDGFIPIKSPNGDIEWCEYKKSKLVRKAKLLEPHVYCLLGDCQNGESIVLVNKEPEFGLSYELSGTFKDGNPVGDFMATGKDPIGYEYTIIGPIKNYKFHGKCAKAYNNYKIAFNGEYKNGLPLNGNFTVNEKLIEIKSFKEGKYIGKQIFPRENQYQNNSRYYEGEFDFYGHIEGSGTVYFETGYKLNASDWKDGKSSKCTFTRPDNYSEDDFYCNIYGGSYFRGLGNQKELDYYAAKRAEEEKARQQVAVNQIQSEHQCGQCNGLGVIKTQCPMCHGAGYRKDMVTYDRHTGNTGGLAKCSHCAGTGQYTLMGCSKCDGKGFIKK